MNVFTNIDDPKHVELFKPSWSPSPKLPEIEEGKIWGRVTCVPADSIPYYRSVKLPRDFWAEFVRETFLRLEATKITEALRIPFVDANFARRARHTLIVNAAERYGNNAISTTVDNHVLFIRRTRSWSTKRSNP